MYYTHEINRDINLTLEELEEALAFDDERRRDEEQEWAISDLTSVKDAIAGGAKIKVRRIKLGFEIVLRLRNAEKSQIVLHSLLVSGGLHTDGGNTIFPFYEFSMHKYQCDTDVRAATEYVRRKLAKLEA